MTMTDRDVDRRLDRLEERLRETEPAESLTGRARASDIAFHRRRLADLEAADELSPAYFTRDQLRDPAFYAEHRRDIDQAVREGRILAPGANPPPEARHLAPSATPTFTTSQLRDAAFYAAHREDILKAQQDGRIMDDQNRAIRQRPAVPGTPVWGSPPKEAHHG